ncbi:MAG: ABC transporter ATP-binding protein [Chloroflexi bacterium]|nr:ABC transporter ATP-binding protein [Chloroflexota bacterium]
MLHVKHVTVQYDNKQILQDITINCAMHSFIALIGPNGAGKSTLLRAIAGIAPITSGDILWQNLAIHRMNAAQRAQHIAVVPQVVVMPSGFTVREVVRMARYARTPWYRSFMDSDEDVVEYALTQSGMNAFADLPANQLSGGEQQRVAFARALAQQPQVLLLDETTAHLDLHHQQAILRCARELTRCGVLVVAAMHDINLAATMADEVVLLNRGRVAFNGTPHDVLTKPILERVYNTELMCIPQAHSSIPFFMVQR